MCLDQGLAREDFDGDVIEYVAVLIDDAILAMRRIRIERDIGQNAKVREALFERAHGAGNEPLRVGRLAAIERLERGVDDGEKRHHRNAQGNALFGDRHQRVERVAHHAWHGRHGLPYALPLCNEHRINKVINR